uniref:Helicase-associated domain-containing protein n=1 Tax=Amorphochlora amoebiformis TaxID=1561963 RepID=A0A7S0DPM4_9EUKA
MYVPKDCFDCSDLGYMSTKIRKAYKDGNLPDTWKTRLHDIGFNFKIDMVDCKWHHNFHILRRYKFVEGHVDLPENYTDPDDPKTVECARWLQRQHVLYRKQKLRPLRVKMLRNIGVKLKRPYSPKRENRHVILLDPEKDKEAIQRWKKRQALSEALKANGTSLRKERQKRVDYYRKKRKEDKYLAKKELNSTK